MNNQPWLLRPEDEDVSCLRHLKLINLDELFRNSQGARIVNSDSLVDADLSDEVVKAVYSNCDGDLGFVPTCACGYTRGVTKTGLTCPKCGTKCNTQFVDSLQHSAWIHIPEGNEQHPAFPAPVLHPTWYMVLKYLTQTGKGDKISLIDYILNPMLERGKDIPDMPEDFKRYVKGRGWEYFYNHADEVMDMFCYEYPNTRNKTGKVHDFEIFRKQYRNLMFTRNLPILHNALHPVTSNGGSLKIIDKTSIALLQAIHDLSIDTYKLSTSKVSAVRRDNMLYKVYKVVTNYYDDLITTKLGQKTGLLRKHVFGGRLHYTFRTVVHAQSKPGPLDEVVLPWGIMVTELKHVILNFLVNRHGCSVADAVDIYANALVQYNKLVDDCMQEYIKETPHKRIPVIIGRNPTIAYGSEQLLFVREYKTDIHDETIAVNACIVKPFNMDFDGDECYGLFIFEDNLASALSAIHPSQLLFSVSDPGLSSRIRLIDEIWVMLENYLTEDPDIEHYEEL